MDIFSKKTLLSAINGGGIYGAASQGQTVKFKFASTIAKALTGKTDDGALIFAVDATSGAGAIWAGTDLVSSRVLDYAIAASSSKDHDQKTVTLTYIDATDGLTTKTFDLIDEAGLKAYFTSSDTITIADGTANVNVDASTILIDSTNKYLKSGLNIYYKAPVTTVGSEENAKIQLRDAHNAMLSEIDVADIIGNGVVDHTTYDSASNTLSIFFKTATGGTQEVKINLSELFDIDDWAVESGSEDFLHLAIDTSTAEIGVKKADVTFTEKSGNTPANLTVDTTNGKILDAADAIPALKSYIDAVQADNSIAVESKNAYIDASVDASNNKKINIEAQTADLTVAAGVAGGNSDSSLSGTAGKLVDAADAASKVQTFVNNRLDEEVKKLDASVDSTGNTFVEVGVAEVDGKVTSVVVHETIGSITGSASDLSGTAGLIDGANTATAVKTYVDGQINALDASVDSDDATYTKVGVKQENGKITDVVVSQTKSTITASDSALSATAGIADGSEFATGVKTYVDGQIDALDSKLDITSSDASLTFDASVVNGKIVEGHIDYVKSTVTFTEASGATPANISANGGFLTGGDVATLKQYIDAVAGALDSSVTDTDNFVTVKTTQENGALSAQDVTVVTADISAGPGAIDVTTDGLVTGSTLETAIENSLKWTIL